MLLAVFWIISRPIEMLLLSSGYSANLQIEDQVYSPILAVISTIFAIQRDVARE